jgi:hypothetical protein
MDILQLPKEARKGHIIPGMKGHLLVSLVQLCQAGCQMQINDRILHGRKCIRTGLWLIPLTKKTVGLSAAGQEPQDVAGNVYHSSSRAEWI